MKRVSTYHANNKANQANDLYTKFGKPNGNKKEKLIDNTLKKKNCENKIPKTQQNSHSKKATQKLNQEINSEFANEGNEKNIILKLIHNNGMKSKIKFPSPNKTFQSNLKQLVEMEPSTNRTQIEDKSIISFSENPNFEKSSKSVLISKENEIPCKCGLDLQFPCCIKARKWIERLGFTKKFDEFTKLISLYSSFSQIDPNDQNYIQIHKDSIRTFPSTKLFSSESKMNNQLERILFAFSKYDPQVGKFLT